MDTPSIKNLALEIGKAGLPALAGAFGGPGASAIANAVIGALAGSPATPAQPQTADDAAKVIAANPEAAKVALASLEIQQTAADMQREIAVAEMARESFFSWGWRPAMSWLIIVLWSYALLVLPLLNVALQATFGLQAIPIQPIPMENLTAFTGIWIAAYSGGNTLIRVMGKKDGGA